MTQLPRILHLVDDTTAGGVMRVLEHITSCPEMARTAEHVVYPLPKGRIALNGQSADVIVSHLALNWRLLPALIGLRAARVQTPLIHVEHSYTEAFTALNVGNKRRFGNMLRLAFSLFDHVVGVSPEQASWLTRRGYCAPHKMTAIMSCIDVSPYRDLPAPETAPKVIGAMGRLDRQKGFDTLIMAFRQVKDRDAALHIYGDGPDREMLQVLAAGDPRIQFCGFRDDMRLAYAEVDAVAMPSRWEACGLVAIEALASGRPLVCADIDGLKTHAKAGATLVTNGTISAWADAIRSVLYPHDSSDTPSSYRHGTPPTTEFAERWNTLLTHVLQAKADPDLASSSLAEAA